MMELVARFSAGVRWAFDCRVLVSCTGVPPKGYRVGARAPRNGLG
jgi:hypothetical protein